MRIILGILASVLSFAALVSGFVLFLALINYFGGESLGIGLPTLAMFIFTAIGAGLSWYWFKSAKGKV